MAPGAATVAFAVDGITETVGEGRGGLLVAPGDVPPMCDAIRSFLKDPLLARTVGSVARDVVRAEFSAGRTAPRVATSIGSLIEGQPAR